MAIFLPPCLRLRISGTVTFCGFIGPPLPGKQRALWTGVQRALHASPVAALVDAVTLAVRGDRRNSSSTAFRRICKRYSVSVRSDPSGSRTYFDSIRLLLLCSAVTQAPLSRKGKVVSLGCR